MQSINVRRIRLGLCLFLTMPLAAYVLLLMIYTPLEAYWPLKVDHSTTGLDKSFELFSPMPYSAGFGFEVDGQIFDVNHVETNINKLPACTMRLTITPIFAVGQDERTYEFDCFNRYVGSYSGTTYPPGDVILPVGFFKVSYSVQIDTPESHNVTLRVAYSGAEGGWSVLYDIIHLMACYIIFPFYMVFSFINSIFNS
ncbi:hypothetical protein ACFOSS_02245 [Pseudaeromonas sharmana]|uniref:Uncharacterized protein n=1 Tax=Pseudaeromonas sharmana TaxID=328412 RepID=A0ABV8CJB1_9GAMM